MCLGDLARVIDLVDDRTVRASVGARIITVSLLTLDGPVSTGDWLHTHSGFALARLTEEEWREAALIRSHTSGGALTHCQETPEAVPGSLGNRL